MNKVKKPLSATLLRLILSLFLVVIAAIATAILYFAYGQLHKTAVDISHTVVDAKASSNNVQTLQKIQKQLEKDKIVVERASNIVADSKSYQYQDQIIQDLNDYARRAGITILDTTFSDGASPGTASGGTAAPATPSKQVPVVKAAPSGVNSTSISITVKNPVPYLSMLQFIKSIEDNLTKMQISKVSLAKDEASDNVISEALTMQVYIR